VSGSPRSPAAAASSRGPRYGPPATCRRSDQRARASAGAASVGDRRVVGAELELMGRIRFGDLLIGTTPTAAKKPSEIIIIGDRGAWSLRDHRGNLSLGSGCRGTRRAARATALLRRLAGALRRATRAAAGGGLLARLRGGFVWSTCLDVLRGRRRLLHPRFGDGRGRRDHRGPARPPLFEGVPSERQECCQGADSADRETWARPALFQPRGAKIARVRSSAKGQSARPKSRSVSKRALGSL
jgi:hypothetical protein